MKRILAAALAGLAMSAASAAEMKIGFVNTERVFREAAPAKRAQQVLEREFSTRNSELARIEKQGRDLTAELERDTGTLTEAQRREKERQGYRREDLPHRALLRTRARAGTGSARPCRCPSS